MKIIELKTENDVIKYVQENATYTGLKYSIRFPETASRAFISEDTYDLVIQMCEKLNIDRRKK